MIHPGFLSQMRHTLNGVSLRKEKYANNSYFEVKPALTKARCDKHKEAGLRIFLNQYPVDPARLSV